MNVILYSHCRYLHGLWFVSSGYLFLLQVGLTPLMLAISRGKLKVVEGIIEQSKTIDLDVPQKVGSYI